jgi:lipid II:glycine glycyltransferase (peptidoglycan interpeptide bridge formation enzyme)
VTIEPWPDPDVDEIISIYRELEAYKGLSAQFSAAELSVLLETFGDQALIYRCVSPQGDLLGLRGCLFTGTQALDYFAATSVHARKMYVSYALMWELLHACIDKGITHYDLNGIDPYANVGVYHFKQGTGAMPLEYLGEWDWATSERVRISMNVLRASKQRFSDKVGRFKALVKQGLTR